MNDIKCSQVFWTLLNILTDHNKGNSQNRLLFRPLGVIPRAPTTIDVIITFMFHRFFSSLARSRYLYIFSLSFISTLWSAGMGWFRRSVCDSKSQRILCVPFSRTTLLNFSLAQFQPFPTIHAYSCISFAPVFCIRLL